jgi:hypothetical protein
VSTFSLEKRQEDGKEEKRIKFDENISSAKPFRSRQVKEIQLDLAHKHLHFKRGGRGESKIERGRDRK